MKLKIDDIRKLGNEPRLHGNGFIQLDLTASSRLHVWPSPNIQPQKVSTQIHDHRFELFSMILCGALIHTEYEIVEDMNGRYHVYHAKPRDREDTQIVRADDKNYSLKQTRWQWMEVNSRYTFPAYLFHETKACGLTATIMKKINSDSSYFPRILCHRTEEPDNEYNRYQVDPKDLWPTIEEALAKIGPIFVSLR